MIIKWEHYTIVSILVILVGFYFESLLVMTSPFILIVILHWRDFSFIQLFKR